jgi:hypothetical protein
MGFSVNGNYGITRLIDAMTRFAQPGSGPSYLRVKKFNDAPQPQSPVYAQMGFTFTPTASGAATGFTDYQIDPPPVMRLISMHNLAMAVAAGTNLREGARDILISNTFVQANMAIRGLTDPKQVFEDVTTLGIVANGIIVSIESVMPDYAYGVPATWTIKGNANELR